MGRNSYAGIVKRGDGSCTRADVCWVYAAPRSWHGLTLPGSRWYADNADALYRSARVDDTSSYEVTAKLSMVMPSQFTVMLYDWLQFETGTTERLDVPVDTMEVTDATPRIPMVQ